MSATLGFAVAGPTGVGKSVFAVELARRVGGEVICADAFQLYEGLAVLTAQPPAELQSQIPHHLYGCVRPSVEMTAGHFAEMAARAAAEVKARGKVPIFVGGAGFYLRALEGGLDPIPFPDPSLRARIAALSNSEALAELQRRDPGALEQIDIRNPRRVTRALEIVIQTGKPLAAAWRGGAPRHSLPGVLLERPRDELRERIEANVVAMLRAGAIEEVRLLPRPAPTASRALGFRQISSYLQGELTFEEMERATISATWHYARRQLTWFRHQSKYQALMVSDAESGQALAEAERWLRQIF